MMTRDLLSFALVGRDRVTGARAGELKTAHGMVRTPAFMPVGTLGNVKAVAPWDLERLGPEMVLANTYHLLLRPGVERLERLGGLHRLMAWDGPILTDSGGYQVFSLAARRKLDEDGVSFRSHLDGSLYRLTPESVVEAQASFGVDIAMVLDECLPYPVEVERVQPSVDRTLRWAERAVLKADELRGRSDAWQGGLFGIQQGALDPKIRRGASEYLKSLPFDGYAIGGLAVGEPPELLHEAVAFSAPLLPEDRPRYLMGVGYPEDILHAISCGVDLFDCVLPTRSARTGKVYTSRGDLVIKNARWSEDLTPLDPDCDCPTCRRYSRAALRHFFMAKEVNSAILLTIHNLHYYLSLMRSAREAMMAGRWDAFRRRCEDMRKIGPEARE